MFKIWWQVLKCIVFGHYWSKPYNMKLKNYYPKWRQIKCKHCQLEKIIQVKP